MSVRTREQHLSPGWAEVHDEMLELPAVADLE